MPETPRCFVYILRCADGSFYVGWTADLDERVRLHNAGLGASWTLKRRPVTLAYAEHVATPQDAVRRELQLKGWSHAKKEALIRGDLPKLKLLARRRKRSPVEH